MVTLNMLRAMVSNANIPENGGTFILRHMMPNTRHLVESNRRLGTTPPTDSVYTFYIPSFEFKIEYGIIHTLQNCLSIKDRLARKSLHCIVKALSLDQGRNCRKKAIVSVGLKL